MAPEAQVVQAAFSGVSKAMYSLDKAQPAATQINSKRAALRFTLSMMATSLSVLLLCCPAGAQGIKLRTLGNEVVSNFKYLTNNASLDTEDIVTSPLYIASSNSPLRSPRFYLFLAGAVAVWGSYYALDQTMRSHLRNMSSSDADLLQNVSYGSVSAATALLHGYGCTTTREHATTRSRRVKVPASQP
jgi:hypothetical protein